MLNLNIKAHFLWATYIFGISCSKGDVIVDTTSPIDTSQETAVEVVPLTCPISEIEETMGSLVAPVLNEVSGVVHSELNDGLLWVHNDSGDSPRIFGITEEGELIVTLNFSGVGAGDFEDIAFGELLYVGDVGDNAGVRESVFVYGVHEPDVEVGLGQYQEDIDVETYELTYPDGPENVEAMWVDPYNDDIYLLAKVTNQPAGVYRKSAPHLDGSTTELELVASLDFSIPPLVGLATGADMSRDGTMIVVRGYIGSWVWLRDVGETVTDALAKPPCQVLVPAERQSESIGFNVDGTGLYSISEGAGEAVYFIPFQE